jgi:hypothetical protein
VLDAIEVFWRLEQYDLFICQFRRPIKHGHPFPANDVPRDGSGLLVTTLCVFDAGILNAGFRALGVGFDEYRLAWRCGAHLGLRSDGIAVMYAEVVEYQEHFLAQALAINDQRLEGSDDFLVVESAIDAHPVRLAACCDRLLSGDNLIPLHTSGECTRQKNPTPVGRGTKDSIVAMDQGGSNIVSGGR